MSSGQVASPSLAIHCAWRACSRRSRLSELGHHGGCFAVMAMYSSTGMGVASVSGANPVAPTGGLGGRPCQAGHTWVPPRRRRVVAAARARAACVWHTRSGDARHVPRRGRAAPRRRPGSAAPPQRWRRPTPCAARRPRGVRLSGPDGARRPRRRPVQPRPVVLGAPVGVDARGRQAPARRGRPPSRRQRPASGAGSAAVTGCAPLARRALWARPGCGRRPPCTTTPTRLTKSKSKRQERPQLWEKTTVQRCTMTRAHASRGTR